MTRIAIAAAGLLLIGGAAAQFLSSAEAGSAPPAQPPVPAPPAQAARNPLLDIDPEHARTWIVLRANDGVRTVKRLRAQPEMALLPPWLNQSLDALASLREAVLVADKDSVMNASWRTWLYQQRQRKATGAKPEPRGEDARIVEDIPFFSGWAICSDEQSPLLVNLRSALNGPPMPASIQSTKDGWNWASRTGNTRISLTGGRVLVSAPESSAAVPASLPTSSLVPAADVEFHLYLDPGRKGSKLLCAATGSVHVEADGLRVTASETHWNDAPCLTATLDRQHFERVPAAAILAGAAAIHPGAHEDHKRFRVVFAGMPLSVEPQDRDTPDSPTTRGYKALHVLLARTNGVLLAWIEPGLPVPSLTIEADMAQADADAVLTAAGLVVAADGTATMTIGPMNFTLGWRAGQLIITSNPGGLDAIDRNGGFINHPEIRRGLAVLPAGTLNACVLLRPLATLDMAMPFGAMFGPAVQKPLMDYRAATDKAHSYGVFCVSNDGSSTRIDAGGVLAMLGCGFLALQASDPAALLQLAN